MITVIKSKPKCYKIKCCFCDAVYTYELEDIKTDYYTEKGTLCPECGKLNPHYNRETNGEPKPLRED